MLFELKSGDFLATLLLSQLAVYLTIFFDIPVARQLIVFLYLAFIPGFAMIRTFRMDELGPLQTVLCSVGISLSILMLMGPLMSEFGTIFGFSRTLSQFPLILVLNTFILAIGISAYVRDQGFRFLHSDDFRFSLKALTQFLTLLLLPILSIAGAAYVNLFGDSLVVVLMIMVISLFFSLVVAFKNIMPAKLYPLLIFVIAISLLYQSSLISSYLVHFGSDVPGEYFVCKLVEKNATWSPLNPYFGDLSVGRSYAMLSVTVLPQIFSVLLSFDQQWVFKLLNPLLFALVPVSLYVIWREHVGPKYAFVSAFFFMSFQTFYTELVGLNKQIIGELFLVLLLFVVLDKRIKHVNKVILFTIFGFALVVSHYALAEIFLLLFLLPVLFLTIMKKQIRSIAITMILYFFAVMFFWYMFTSSSSVLTSFTSFGENVYNQLGDFFQVESRGTQVLRGLGLEAAPTIWNVFSRFFAYLTELFVILGFIGLITKRTGLRLEKDYYLFTFVSMAFLGVLIIVPGLSSTMNMTRFYHILLFFLAPLLVIGIEVVIGLVVRHKNQLMISTLILVVLVPYFLFQTNFVYELTKSGSWSLPLSKHRMSKSETYRKFGYMDAYTVFGAQWVGRNVVHGYSQIYADDDSRRNELRAYGGIYVGSVEVLSNVTQIAGNGIVYFNPSNVLEGRIVGTYYVWNTSDLRFLGELDIIYSNGESEVYKNGP